MAEKIISASLKVDTGTSVQDISNVNKELDKTSTELKQTNEESKETTGSFTNLKGALGQIPGPLGAVNQGVNTVNTSLKALAANPIVLVITLLVAALVAVYKAFASTEAGAEKLEQIFSGLGAIVTVIRDRILALAGAVISFFKGDFTAAAEQAKAAVTGVGDAIVNAYSKAADATRMLQEAQDELNRSINVDRARLNRDLAQTKELISDTTASYKDRKAAVDAVREAEAKQAAAELANAEKTMAALQQKYELDKQDSDLADQIAEQQVKIFNIQQQSAQDQRSLNKQSKQIEQEALQRRKESAAEYDRIRKEQLAAEKKEIDERNAMMKASVESWQKYVNDGIEFRQQLAEERKKQDEQEQKERDEYQKNIEAQEIASIDRVLKAHKDSAEAEKKIEEEKLAFRESILQTTSNLLGALANLLGKQTVAGKALAIVQTTIDTYQSAISSYKSLAGIPVIGPTLGFAAAAAAIANGLATVKQIVSVKVPGGAGDVSGGNISAPALTAPAPIAPQQQSTTLDQNAIQGIGNATSGRAYVVEADVTRDQNRYERLNRAAQLGG